MSTDNETLKCGLHLVETSDETNIVLHPNGKYEFIFKPQVANTINSSVKGYILVVTSDEPIKIGDLALHIPQGKISEYTHITKSINALSGNYRKIIGLSIVKSHPIKHFLYPQLSIRFIKEIISKYNNNIQVKSAMVDVETDGIYCEIEESGNDCDCYGCQGFCDWEQLYKPIIDDCHQLVITLKLSEQDIQKELITKALRDFRTECLDFGEVSDYTLNRFRDKWFEENIK